MTLGTQIISHGAWVGIIRCFDIPILYFCEYFMYPRNNNPNNIYSYLGAAIIFSVILFFSIKALIKQLKYSQNISNHIDKQIGTYFLISWGYISLGGSHIIIRV